MRNEVLRMLPQTVQIALTGIPDAQIEELRLRVGQKPAVLYAGGERPLSVRTVLLQKELQQTLLNASAQSQYAVQEQLRSGYLSLSGGYRLGVCGSAVVQNGCMTGCGRSRRLRSVFRTISGTRRSGCFHIYRNPVCLPVRPAAEKRRCCAAASGHFRKTGSAWPSWTSGWSWPERCTAYRSLTSGRVRTCCPAVRRARGC